MHAVCFVECLNKFKLSCFGIPQTHLDLVQFCHYVCTMHLLIAAYLGRSGFAYAFTEGLLTLVSRKMSRTEDCLYQQVSLFYKDLDKFAFKLVWTQCILISSKEVQLAHQYMNGCSAEEFQCGHIVTHSVAHARGQQFATDTIPNVPCTQLLAGTPTRQQVSSSPLPPVQARGKQIASCYELFLQQNPWRKKVSVLVFMHYGPHATQTTKDHLEKNKDVNEVSGDISYKPNL